MATCFNRYTGRYERCDSRWYDWGRWVALGVIIFVFFLFFFLCSCITARRRRRAGAKPFYGTGWAANNRWGGPPAPSYQPPYGNPQQPNNSGWGGNQPAPAYNQGGHYGENQGYYGGQQTEMQTPQNTYRGGDNVYQPPTGPPPGK